MKNLLVALVLLFTACAHAQRPHVSKEADAHVAAGVDALSTGNLDRAEAEFHMALEYAPRMPHALNGLGLVAMRRGQAADARRWFQAAVRADDDFAEAHANLGALALDQGDAEGALRPLQSALAIDPGYVPARHNLARALTILGRFQEAREEYMKLTSTARDDAGAWAELAAVELALGNRAAAGRAAETAIEIDPMQPVAHRVRGDLLRDAGDVDAAIVEYDAVLALSPSNVDALIGRGVAKLLVGRGDEARVDLERAVAIAPESAVAHFALGAALAAGGDDARAVEELGLAIELAPRPYPEAHYLRAGAYARLGMKREALAEYEQFLREADGDDTLASAVADARAQMAVLRGR